MNDAKSDMFSIQNELLKLQPKDCLDYLIEQPNCLKVIREVPAQDLFLMLKEAGVRENLEVLELIAPEQFQSFLDLDTWQNGHIDPIAVGFWLGSIAEANFQKAVQTFSKLDVEYISLLLKMYTSVYDTTLEEEPPDMGLTHSTTPDNRYIVVFHGSKNEEELIHFLKRCLDQLYQRNSSFVSRIIESIRWETTSMLEEESMRWRDGRLQDLGFAPLAEEKEILGFVDPVKQLSPDLPESSSSEKVFASLLVKETESHSLFQKAISTAPEKLQQRIYQELVSVTNRVHVALGIDPGNISALRDSAHYTTNTVEAALAYLSKGDESILLDLLTGFSVKKLFQIGRSLSLRLGRDFKKIISDPNASLKGKGILRLDSPLAEVVAGIVLPNPVYYCGLSDRKKLEYRRFENLADIANTAKAISQATFRSYLLGKKGLGLTEKVVEELKITDQAKIPTHGIFLATWLCNQLLGKAPDFSPLNKQDVQAIANRFVVGEKGKQLAAADLAFSTTLVQTIARGLVPLPGIKDDAEANLKAKQYVGTVLLVVESELSQITDTDIDLRFISSLLTEKE